MPDLITAAVGAYMMLLVVLAWIDLYQTGE